MSTQNGLTVASYVRHLELKKRTLATIASYTWWIDDLAIWLDHRDVLDATREDLEDYFLWLRQELADTSEAVAYRTLRAFYNWAVRDELLDVSPMAKIDPPQVKGRPDQLATDEELTALLKVCAGKDFLSRRDTAMIRLMCEPGTPRRAELPGQLLEHLDMRRSQITFIGKGQKWRTIPFGNKTGRALELYLRVRAQHPLAHLPQLWLGQRGMAMTKWGPGQMLARRCAEAGIRKLNPHDLRHASYNAWRNQGGSEDDAEVLFGWSPNSRMGRLYGRSQKLTRAERAARKLSVADRL